MSDATTATATTATATATSGAQTSATQTAATSGVGEPWIKDFIAPDFSLNHKALERMPEHLKGFAPTLQKYQNFESLIVGMQNQQVMLGKKALAPLPGDANEAARTERKALLDTINGVPTTAKDYQITKPQDLPDNAWNQPLADAFTNWAHKHIVPPSAAKELIAMTAESTKAQLVAQQQGEQSFWAEQQKTFETILKTENIPADRAAALVEKGAIALGLDLNNEGTKIFLKGSDARLMAMRHAMATGEDQVANGQTSSSESDPASQAKSAQQDPSNPLYAPYWNRDGKYSRAAQDAAVAKVNEWFRQAEVKGAKR